MRQLILVRYGEIYLKGLNRPYFMRALVSRVKQAVRPFGGRVWLHDARIFISDMNDMDGCMQAVSKATTSAESFRMTYSLVKRAVPGGRNGKGRF